MEKSKNTIEALIKYKRARNIIEEQAAPQRINKEEK